jgi:hypothetical protein
VRLFSCCSNIYVHAASDRYSADGYFYKATVTKVLYPGDLEYDVDYVTYAEKAG